MNNFQINLINLLHRFREKFAEIKLNEKQEKQKRGSLSFYDYMSALLSIYLDLSLELKAKLKKYNVLEFKQKNLKQTLCLNTFYLLGF